VVKLAVLGLDDAGDLRTVHDLGAVDVQVLDAMPLAFENVEDDVDAAEIFAEDQLARDADVDVAMVLEIVFELDDVVVDQGRIEDAAHHAQESPAGID